MSRRADIQQLIVNNHRRLQKLKEQQALFGLSADPSIALQIENIEAEIDELQAELETLPDASGDDAAAPAAGSGPSVGGGRIINTGGGAYIEGQVSTRGGTFVGRDQYQSGLSAADVADLFRPIYDRIDSRPNTDPEDKADLKSEVKEFQEEAVKGEEADETFLRRRLRNIKRMAPDILEVVTATLTGPAVGLSAVARKVAGQMKASAGDGDT